jgi:hypothetical protein
MLITSQHKLHRKHCSLLLYPPATLEMCLSVKLLIPAVVYLRVPQSLPSITCICHNAIHGNYVTEIYFYMYMILKRLKPEYSLNNV